MPRAADGRPRNEQNPPRLPSGCGLAAVVAQPQSPRGDVSGAHPAV